MSHPSTSTRSRTRRGTRVLAAAVAAPVVAALLAACGSDGPTSTTSSSGSDEGFTPVTVEHAFGATTIEEQPERVATWGWGSADAAIALGVVPVAIPRQSYGADAEGYLPWITQAIEATEGAEAPALLTDGGAPPFEEIIAAAPDVILAGYSGITQADYDKLSQIAPTIAYPDQPWATPWREVITTVGDVLGKSDEASSLLEEIDATVAQAARDHPQFEGKTIAAVAVDPTTFYVYRGADPRVQFLEDLGFTLAPSVDELDTEETTFYYTLSTEQVDQLTSDVLLSYSETAEDAARVASAPELQAMQQLQQGTVATVEGASLISSVSPPTALSLTWGLEDFVTALDAAVANVP